MHRLVQTEKRQQREQRHLHLQKQDEGEAFSSSVYNNTQDLTLNSLLLPPQLNDVEIKESVDGDEKSWGLWHEHRGSMRRYTLQGRSPLVKISWLKDLKELQQCSSQPTNSKRKINAF